MAPRPVAASQVKSVQADLAAIGGNRPFTERFGDAVKAFGSVFFGPLVPSTPSKEIQEEGPRRWPFMPGYNAHITPRGSEGLTPFSTLVNISQLYDTAAMCILYRVEEISAMDWTVVDLDPKHPASDQEKADYAAFLAKPDGITQLEDWLAALVEEVLVTDALSIYLPRSRTNQVLGFELVDGTTIRTLADGHGRQPQPPSPSHQQIINGRIAWEGTSQDFLYAPKNRRVRSLYGRSPTENLVLGINRALRRQVFDLAYYAEGNIPEALVPVGDLTPDQLDDLQAWFDGIAGQPEQVRRVHLIPATTGKITPFEFKRPILDEKIELFLDKRCMAMYGITSGSLGFDPGTQGTGALQENVSYQRSIALTRFVRRIIHALMTEYRISQPSQAFGGVKASTKKWNCRIQLKGEEPEEDKVRQSSVDHTYWSMGKTTVNELRKRDGEDPIEGLDDPFLMLPTGPVDLKLALQAAQGNHGMPPAPTPPPGKVGPDGKPVNPFSKNPTEEPGQGAGSDKEAPGERSDDGKPASGMPSAVDTTSLTRSVSPEPPSGDEGDKLLQIVNSWLERDISTADGLTNHDLQGGTPTPPTGDCGCPEGEPCDCGVDCPDCGDDCCPQGLERSSVDPLPLPTQPYMTNSAGKRIPLPGDVTDKLNTVIQMAAEGGFSGVTLVGSFANGDSDKGGEGTSDIDVLLHPLEGLEDGDSRAQSVEDSLNADGRPVEISVGPYLSIDMEGWTPCYVTLWGSTDVQAASDMVGDQPKVGPPIGYPSPATGPVDAVSRRAEVTVDPPNVPTGAEGFGTTDPSVLQGPTKSGTLSGDISRVGFFTDETGVHPLRDSDGYSGDKGGDPKGSKAEPVKPEKEAPKPPDKFKTSKAAEEWLHEQFPNTRFDFKGASPALLQPLAAQLSHLGTQWPGIMENMRYVGTYLGSQGKAGLDNWLGDKRGAIAQASYHGETIGKGTHYNAGGSIGLNPHIWGSPEAMAAAQVDYSAKGSSPWHPEGTGDPRGMGTFTHEFGHLVMGYLTGSATESEKVSTMHAPVNERAQTATLKFLADTDTPHFRSDAGAVSGYARFAAENGEKYGIRFREEAFAEGFRATQLQPRSEWSPYTERLHSLLTEVRKGL